MPTGFDHRQIHFCVFAVLLQHTTGLAHQIDQADTLAAQQAHTVLWQPPGRARSMLARAAAVSRCSHRSLPTTLHRTLQLSAAAAAMSTTTQQGATEVAVSISPAGLGRITLCRDRQLNALGAAHVEALHSQLLQWAAAAASAGSLSSSAVTCVLLDSNNERAFCSGG